MAASASRPDEVPAHMKERLKAAYDVIAPKYNTWTVRHSAQRLQYLDRVLALLGVSSTVTGSASSASTASTGEAADTTATTEASASRGPASSSLHVLELGCGAGVPVAEHLLRTVEPSVRIIANDMSSTQIQLAKAALGEHGEKVRAASNSWVEWIQGDMMALQFPVAADNHGATAAAAAGNATEPTSGFDAVLALYSVIHLPRDQQAELLVRIAGWLRPGGYLLANFSAEAFPAVVFERWMHDENGWMFWSGWGADGTRDKIREAGLAIVTEAVERDTEDASFYWVIAQKPLEPSFNVL